MHFIRRPTWNEAFGIRHAHWRILDHVALDTAVVPVAVRRVSTTREVDGDNAVAPEDVRTKGGGTSRLVVRRGCHQVGLEEVNCGAREFENFREIRAGQFFHAHQAFRRVLQYVDRAVVGGVVNRVAPCEGVNDPGKPFLAFHERLDAAAGHRLNRCANRADGKRRETGARSSGQLDSHRAIDRGRAVASQTDQGRQRLAEAVREFLRNVGESVVDGGRKSKARERRVVGINVCLGNLRHHRLALMVAHEFRLYLQLRSLLLSA